MKTPPDGESGGVDSDVTASNRANAFAHVNRPIDLKQPESVSATIGAGQKLDRRTVFQLSGFTVVAHSTRPLMGMNEYPKARILRGKWVLHAQNGVSI